jgi:hypothetical protein
LLVPPPSRSELGERGTAEVWPPRHGKERADPPGEATSEAEAAREPPCLSKQFRPLPEPQPLLCALAGGTANVPSQVAFEHRDGGGG